MEEKLEKDEEEKQEEHKEERQKEEGEVEEGNSEENLEEMEERQMESEEKEGWKKRKRWESTVIPCTVEVLRFLANILILLYPSLLIPYCNHTQPLARFISPASLQPRRR